MGVQIIGAPTARKLPPRSGPIKASIVHTTGDTDLDKILRWYESADGLQPHYMIATDATIRRFVMEDHIAWHAKIDPAEARLYQRGYGEWSCWTWPLSAGAPVHVGQEFSGYRMWRDRWPGLQSPLELVTADHPNSVSVGIELQQPVKPGPGIFTPGQYQALAELLVDIHGRTGVPLDRQHVLGHSDCSPMRRSTAAGGWDPGVTFDWNRLWDLVRAVSGAQP
jgi:N-acetyl-anhydromuramyl-L-alanine amidase AmpD